VVYVFLLKKYHYSELTNIVNQVIKITKKKYQMAFTT